MQRSYLTVAYSSHDSRLQHYQLCTSQWCAVVGVTRAHSHCATHSLPSLSLYPLALAEPNPSHSLVVTVIAILVPANYRIASPSTTSNSLFQPKLNPNQLLIIFRSSKDTSSRLEFAASSRIAPLFLRPAVVPYRAWAFDRHHPSAHPTRHLHSVRRQAASKQRNEFDWEPALAPRSLALRL